MAESCPEMQKRFRQAEQFERDDDDFVDAAEGKKGTDCVAKINTNWQNIILLSKATHKE